MKSNRYAHLLLIVSSFLLLIIFFPSPLPADEDLRQGEFASCTSIMVGKLASQDGSTMTSHSCDSNSDRTWMTIVPRKTHKSGDLCPIYIDAKNTKGPSDPDRKVAGTIPQVRETYGYLNAAYPIMNEFQLAIGETTIGGRRELLSKNGIIDAPELFRLLLERARTAREAIRIADELTKAHGYNDYGESFTFADKTEVWLFEIYGPGEGKKGAVWAAQRIPDDHVSVSANASRLRRLDLEKPDWFMASDNVHALAKEKGWWNPQSGEPFEFCYAYAPTSRTSLGCRRREWRVLSLLAPGIKLDPQSENYPFSVKPEKKVTLPDILAIFRDTYEETPFDMTRTLTIVDKENRTVKSPVATPFMNGDLRDLLGINRERLICSPTCTYLQITQSREWLPDAIGGVVWIGYDLPAATPHLPFYIGIGQMPASYMVDGRREYRQDCAWWAFRTVAKLAQFRWQEMKIDIEAVWKEIEGRIFDTREKWEAEAARLWQKDPKKARAYLTRICSETAEAAVISYKKLAGDLWVKYSRSF